MEITEEKLYAAFGLNPDKGGKDQGTADPEPGATEQDPGQSSQTEGEPVGQDNTPEGAAAGDPDSTGGIRADPNDTSGENGRQDPNNVGQNNITDAGQGQNPAQSEEERRANAARRRQAETQAAVDAALRQARQEWERERSEQQKAFFQQAGLLNPFTKEPITNMEEFQAWRDRQDEQKLQKELQSGKLTKETLNGLIDSNPTVQEMRQSQEARRREAEQARQQAMQESVQRQLEEIRKTDPSVRDVADLLGKPYGKALYEFVKKGNNFVDAFYLATRGQMLEAKRQAAQQAAVNNITGKDHLKATSIGGRPGATVTQEEREMYHLFNPKASESDIQKFQNRFKKG